VEKSAKRLWESGERAEEEKDIRLAVISYESIRNGFYGASHVFRPRKDWIQRSEAKIRSLSFGQGKGDAAAARKDPQPDVLWSVVVVVSFLGWVGSLTGLARWGLGKERHGGGIVHKPFAWIGLAILLFGLWILGMAFA
jgi:hypothetical protein